MAKTTSTPLTALAVGAGAARSADAANGPRGFARLTLSALLVVIALTSAVVACSDSADSGSRLGAGSSGTNGAGADGGPVSATPSGPPAEEILFRGLEKDLALKCGGTCHATGAYKPTPPTFLAPPDAYKSVKAQPGVVVVDFYQSSLLSRGAHAGPAISDDPTFEAKIIEWLKMESLVIQSQRSVCCTRCTSAVLDGDRGVTQTRGRGSSRRPTSATRPRSLRAAGR